MNINPESHKWLHKVRDKQRNLVFSDTARNFGGFWAGLDRQKLDSVQAVGLGILVVFYVVLLTGLVAMPWPQGDASLGHRILQGYGPYLLLSLPLVIFFLLLRSQL